MGAEKKVSDVVAEFIEAAGIEDVFVLSGGMIAHLIDSVARRNRLRLVLVSHEQSGGFAVEGQAKFTDRPGVAFGTSGPGALNLVTPIASCFYDSVPALFITGQVQTYLSRKARPVRQFGLQESPFGAVVESITKGVWVVNDPKEIVATLDTAYAAATTGRPGPVVVEIPFDVQNMKVETTITPRQPAASSAPTTEQVREVTSHLEEAQKPLLLVGGGVRARGNRDAVRSYARTHQIPVVSTIAALDVLPHDDPLHLGLTGTYGRRSANLAVANADFIMVLGSRLDQGVTGGDVLSWKRNKKVAQIDCDGGELGARLKGTICVQADIAEFIELCTAQQAPRPSEARLAWNAHVRDLAQRYPDTDELRGVAGINPNEFLRRLSSCSEKAAAFVVDAGQHTWWSAQSLRLRDGQRFLASTGLWAMGAALPMAMGVALSARAPVVAIAGDGAAQLNIQELWTIRSLNIPVKLIVLDNGSHGMVRQFQDDILEGRHYGTQWGYSRPDFPAVAAGFGVPSFSVSQSSDVDDGLRWLWRDPQEPALLHVTIPDDVRVYPEVPFGKPLSEMRASA